MVNLIYGANYCAYPDPHGRLVHMVLFVDLPLGGLGYTHEDAIRTGEFSLRGYLEYSSGPIPKFPKRDTVVQFYIDPASIQKKYQPI